MAGRRLFPPQQKFQWASTEAARQLYDLTLSDPSFQPEGGPQAWINNRTNELQQEINDAGGQPGGGAPAPKPPAMSPADITASLANAKAALAKHPDQRATIINRLKAAGVPITGL